MQHDRDDLDIERETRRVSQRLLGMIDESFLHEIQQLGLDEMVRLTGSQVGFLYIVDQGDDTVGLHLASLNGHPPPPPIHGNGVDPSQDDYWSQCLADHGPVIRNQPVDLAPPLAGDAGPISRDLTVPVHAEDKVVAVVMVGNRPTDYGPAEAELLRALAAGLWRVVVRKRLHDRISDDVK